MTSPTQRAMADLRKEGGIVAIVERWNPYAKIRQDLYGIFDLLWADEKSRRIVGIQVTSSGNVSARIKKIIESETATPWLLAGGAIEIWGYAKRGPRGKRKTWTRRVVGIRLQDGVLQEFPCYESSLSAPSPKIRKRGGGSCTRSRKTTASS